MAGNYAGNSTPTQPIGGLELYAGNGTTYKNWKCSTIVVSADTANYTINGNNFLLSDSGSASIGTSIDLVVTPSSLTAAPVGVYFLFYDCDCNSPMTGTTVSSPVPGATIIGGGGLNS
mgnify:CR=1 FL=1